MKRAQKLPRAPRGAARCSAGGAQRPVCGAPVMPTMAGAFRYASRKPRLTAIVDHSRVSCATAGIVRATYIGSWQTGRRERKWQFSIRALYFSSAPKNRKRPAWLRQSPMHAP